MKIDEFLELHEELCDEARGLCRQKGADYSGDEDTLANFKAVEAMGICSAETAILVLLCIKLSRLVQLVGHGRDPQIKGETAEDSIQDSINYNALLKGVLVDKAQAQKERAVDAAAYSAEAATKAACRAPTKTDAPDRPWTAAGRSRNGGPIITVDGKEMTRGETAVIDVGGIRMIVRYPDEIEGDRDAD